MKKLTLILVLLFSQVTFAQTPPSHCFTDLIFGKAFLAINTDQESDLVFWYQETFGMEVLKRFQSEDGTTVGVILKKNNFYVEILHSSKIREDFKEQSGQIVKRGIKKVGIFVDKPVEEFQTCLKNHNLKVGRIFHDREMGVKLLHLTDPEGNELEIISEE